MNIWQVDFYKSSGKNEDHQILWELSIINPIDNFTYTVFCPQSDANSNWLINQLENAGKQQGFLPDKIQLFRPQSLNLINIAGEKLNIKIEPTRRTLILKQWLENKGNKIILDQPPPQPLPENLLGEKWRFASIPASDLIELVSDKLIPIMSMPQFLLPINVGIASTTIIPGIIIYGGKSSMRLARWLQENDIYYIDYMQAETGGLVLESGLVDRWIIAT
ncbi:MAG TPA: Tab2 family RNA-binding protein, partial [Allocoleopsis sp.]